MLGELHRSQKNPATMVVSLWNRGFKEERKDKIMGVLWPSCLHSWDRELGKLNGTDWNHFTLCLFFKNTHFYFSFSSTHPDRAPLCSLDLVYTLEGFASLVLSAAPHEAFSSEAGILMMLWEFLRELTNMKGAFLYILAYLLTFFFLFQIRKSPY